METEALIRKVTYSDKSVKRTLCLKTKQGLTEIKISQKEYDNLKKLDVKSTETFYGQK